MKYISQLNAYWNWVKLNDLPSRAGYLYFAILDCANTAGWKGEFNAPNSTLQAMAGLDKSSLVRYRNMLIQMGLINYQPGKRGTSGLYTIVPLYDTNNDTNIDTNIATNNEPILLPITNQSAYPNRVHTKSKSKSKSKSNIITPLSPNGDNAPLRGDTPSKYAYGEFNNVLLTDNELDKLKTRFDDWERRIERLSQYMASHSKRYKSHYATILTWADKDAKEAERDGTKQAASEQDLSAFGNYY